MRMIATLAFVLAVGSVDRAVACGGVVVPKTATVQMKAQRAFVSVRANGSTDLVTQLSVPTATADYGALLPVPAEPWIDPTPVDSEELDSVDRQTAVQYSAPAPEQSGCGCGSAGAEAGSQGGVQAGTFVNVGPVTAVKLKADSITALTQWLTDNGFAIPTDQVSAVDPYIKQDGWFVAFKRNESAPPGTASSVGVHVILPSDQRCYPLAISRLGATDDLAITVFVVAPDGVGPSAPFVGLTLADLGYHPENLDDAAAVTAGYREAMRVAIEKHDFRAFVVEGVHDVTGNLTLPPRLSAMVDPAAKLTRLSTLLPPSALTGNVEFMAPAPAGAEETHARNERGSSPYGLALLVCPALALGLRRKKRS